MDRNDVIEKVFPHSLFGYDPIAVDAFLDEVIREFDRLNNTIDVLQFRLAHELGDALQQNDRLSVELEYAEFGRRVNELIAPPAEDDEPDLAAQLASDGEYAADEREHYEELAEEPEKAPGEELTEDHAEAPEEVRTEEPAEQNL